MINNQVNILNYLPFSLVHRVKNEYGPQTQQSCTDALDKLMNPQNSDTSKKRQVLPANDDTPNKFNNMSSNIKSNFGNNGALNERLGQLEQTINLTPVSSDVYKRIKDIESRIIYLETVSPEYNKFMVTFVLIQHGSIA